jgi:hypothetical protein
VTAAAYVYIHDGGRRPRELTLLTQIDRFGVMAVLGRPVLGAKEIRLMSIAENITHWYAERQQSQNWATWATENPEKSAGLTMAHNMALELGLLNAD